MDADVKAFRMGIKAFELASPLMRRHLTRFAIETYPDLYEEIIRDYERDRKRMSRTVSRTQVASCPGHTPPVVPDSVPDNSRRKVSPRPPSKPLPTDLPGFSEFWALYPRKTGKGRARKAWEIKRCEGISDLVVSALREQLPALEREGQRSNGNFCPHPTTWLNDTRWEDEPESERKSLSKRLWDEGQQEADRAQS